MYCPNCGAELENDAQECPICGYQLDDEYEHNDFSDINDEKVCPVCGMEVEPSTIKNNQTEPVLLKEPICNNILVLNCTKDKISKNSLQSIFYLCILNL